MNYLIVSNDLSDSGQNIQANRKKTFTHMQAGCFQYSEKKATDDMGQRPSQTSHLLLETTHQTAAGFSG